MIPLRQSLAERSQDVLDWIDYRPEANFWPLFAVPPMLSIAWAYGGTVGLGVMLVGVLLLTLLVAFFTVIGVASWIALRSMTDVVVVRFARRERRSTPSRASALYGR